VTQYASAAEFRSFGLAAAAVAGYTDQQINAFLGLASSKANGYIRARYALPLVTWGDDLKLAVCQIAALLLLTQRGFDPSNPADLAISKASDDAIRYLEQVAKGVVSINVETTSPAARPAAFVYSSPRRGW
jgi:phage gp36-like protein